MPYAVKRLYHSTHLVPDHGEANTFFPKVFGRESKGLADYLGGGRRQIAPRYPTDYATFTPVAEVLVECIDPALLIVDGVQPYESVTEPHLSGVAWFVDGIENLWAELRRRRIRGTDNLNVVAEGGGPPLDPSMTPIIFTVPADTGLRYEFCVYLPRRDPRGDPPVPALSPSDPLGIERCSHHTVLTDRSDRAISLLVDVLSGQVIHAERNAILATQSTYIGLAGGVFEIAEPLEDGSPVMEDWKRRAPEDTYHSLTWQVRDLDQVADHLQASGIGIRAKSATMIVTNPADSLGVPWGFTTAAVPGDPRG
jgi:hypothetical protein